MGPRAVCREKATMSRVNWAFADSDKGRMLRDLYRKEWVGWKSAEQNCRCDVEPEDRNMILDAFPGW